MIDRETPYDENEKRVSDYIQLITNGVIGSGDDPIGFLIASHHSILNELNELKCSGGIPVGVPKFSPEDDSSGRIVQLRPQKP